MYAIRSYYDIIVVGDLMQLPNVIPENTKKMIEPITQSYNLQDGYKYENNSLLSSICSIFPEVSRTLLREHRITSYNVCYTKLLRSRLNTSH